MLGYRSLCVAGEVYGDEVEQLDGKHEKILRSAQNAKKDERNVDKLLETFFDKYADANACE